MDLYSHWQKKNYYRNIADVTSLAIILIALMALIDFLSISSTGVQLIVEIRASQVFAGYFLVRVIAGRSRSPSKSFELLVGIAFTALAFYICQSYYIFINAVESEELKQLGTIGGLANLALAHYFLHRQRKIYYLFSCLYLISNSVLIFWDSEHSHHISQFIILHIGLFIATSYLRAHFIEELKSRYRILMHIVSKANAYDMAVSGEKFIDEEKYRPKVKHVVCYNSDWREYQTLASELCSEQISEMFTEYYTLVMRALEKVDPTGNYFVDHTADNLFIIFFDEDSAYSYSSAISTALKFAIIHSQDVFHAFNRYRNKPVYFDIGIAAGEALVGLQGATGLKKTTVIGELPGIAKRLEEQAKYFRNQGLNHQCQPVICINDSLFAKADKGLLQELGTFHKTLATMKNISSQVVYTTYDLTQTTMLNFRKKTKLG